MNPRSASRAAAQAAPAATAPAGGSATSPARLPQPPTETERDHYWGPQRRWIPVASAMSSALITISLWWLIADRSWAAALLVVLGLSMASCLLTVVTSARRRRETWVSHRLRVRSWRPDQHPSVDVLLPTAGEDIDVLRNTYRHVANLRWAGRLRIYVLDDSGRTCVRELADEYRFSYLSRPDRGQCKKAGNLRYGFARSDGELVSVLDADFAPRADLLDELVPYFEDPTVGIVQSPQYFDLEKTMNWMQLSAGATQVLFYRWTQPSWDRDDASICVGTSALYRRAALDAIGGFAQIEHSEDIHTGVNLLAAGLRQRYVPTLVAKGLCPDGLGSFLAQQYRWCAGSMTLLFSARFHRISMSTRQRLSYWAGFLYYLDTAVNALLTCLPPILLATFAPETVNPRNFLVLILALCVRSAVVPFLSDGRDSLIGLARIQVAYSFAHALAIVDVLRHRPQTWQASGASTSAPSGNRTVRFVRVWIGTTQLLLWATLLWRAPVYGWASYSLMALFAVYQLAVVYPILLDSSGVRIGNRWANPLWLRRRLPGYLSTATAP